jgi:hypothetical protein
MKTTEIRKRFETLSLMMRRHRYHLSLCTLQSSLWLVFITIVYLGPFSTSTAVPFYVFCLSSFLPCSYLILTTSLSLSLSLALQVSEWELEPLNDEDDDDQSGHHHFVSPPAVPPASSIGKSLQRQMIKAVSAAMVHENEPSAFLFSETVTPEVSRPL